MPWVGIRPELPTDVDAIRAVNLTSFETAAEAKLVDALRERAMPVVSLVAEEEGAIVGHIMFSPATVENRPGLRMMGLGPMAVAAPFRRRGIGSSLVREGLDACRRIGVCGVVVLGHPTYYPRFGFRAASRFGLRTEYDVPDEVFMAVDLAPGCLPGAAGTIAYHPAFADL
jgi:putative acetyltransferase